MIVDERQYQSTKERIEQFEQALRAPEPTTDDPDSAILRRATRQGLESMLQDLREQAADYELLRDGATVLELHSLPAVPTVLIHARTRVGLTQADLAARAGFTEEQVRCFEATQYARASLAQVQAVLDALGIRISERLLVPWGAADDGRPEPGA